MIPEQETATSSVEGSRPSNATTTMSTQPATESALAHNNQTCDTRRNVATIESEDNSLKGKQKIWDLSLV